MLRNNRIEYVSVGSLARNNSLEFYKYFFHHFDSFRLLENEQNCFYGERGWFPEGWVVGGEGAGDAGLRRSVCIQITYISFGEKNCIKFKITSLKHKHSTPKSRPGITPKIICSFSGLFTWNCLAFFFFVVTACGLFLFCSLTALIFRQIICHPIHHAKGCKDTPYSFA